MRSRSVQSVFWTQVIVRRKDIFHKLFYVILFQSVQNVTVTCLGKKLGSSIGLFCDLKDGLHYFLTLDRASVRWDTKFPISVNYYT